MPLPIWLTTLFGFVKSGHAALTAGAELKRGEAVKLYVSEQEANAVLRAERDALRERVRELEAAAKVVNELRVERNAVWTAAGVAHCQTCYATGRGELVPLTRPPTLEGRWPSGHCGKCGTAVWLVDPDNPPPRAPAPPRTRFRNSWISGWRD